MNRVRPGAVVICPKGSAAAADCAAQGSALLSVWAAQGSTGGSNPTQASAQAGEKPAGPSGAELRAAQKELNANERKVGQLEEKIAKVHAKMADHDQSDYEGLAKFTAEINDYQSQIDELEERWLELSELLG